MGVLLNVFRTVVIIWNILFLIIGLVLFGVGLFLRFGDAVIESSLSEVESSLEKALSDSGFGNVEIDVDWGSFFFETALALIFSGLALTAVTLFGCCGACYKIKCLLITYVVVCVTLWVGQTVTVGLIYASPETIQDPMKTNLKSSIQSKYEGLNGTNIVSLAWNVVMRKMKCCGVDSYADFTGASNWITDYTSYVPSVTLKTPLACCKTLPSSKDFTCAGATASAADNFLNTGCFDVIWDMIFNNSTAVILGILSTIQLLLIVFTIVILCSDRNAKQNQIAPDDTIDTSSNEKRSKLKTPKLMFRETAWKDSRGAPVKRETATIKSWEPMENLSF